MDTWSRTRGSNIRCISKKHHKNSTVSSSSGEHFLFSCFSENRTAGREGHSEKENDEYLETTLTFDLSLTGGLEFEQDDDGNEQEVGGKKGENGA